MSLKRLFLVGSVWSFVGSSGQPLISFFVFLYIARKVTPADVGLVAFAMIFIDLLGYVSRFGQLETLQRQTDLPDTAIDTSFWMLTAAGLLITAMIAGGAEFLTELRPEASFATVLMLLSPVCVLQALSAAPEALLRRRFAYRSLAIRSWLATLVGGGIGVVLAYLGYGVYALVWQRLALTLSTTVTTWVAIGWMPRLRFDTGEARRLAATGAEIMLSGFSGMMNLRIADAITGSILGVTQLGYLRFGSRFIDFIEQLCVIPVVNVALPTFARLQHDPAALQRAYLRMTQFMAIIALPMWFGIGTVADIFIPLMFGAKWAESAIVVQILGFVIVAGTVSFFFRSIMVAIGEVRVVLRQSIAQVFLTAILIYLGTYFGLVGVLIAIVVRGLLVALYNLFALKKAIELRITSLSAVLLPPVISCFAMVGVVMFVKAQLADTLAPVPLLVTLVAIGVVTYPAILLLGDYLGLWRSYFRSAIGALAGARRRDPGLTVTPP